MRILLFLLTFCSLTVLAGPGVQISLRNPTAKSIPLIIPKVMNPNLSPFSRSGVRLEIGQEIFYKQNGKKRLLLVIDESYSDAELNVAKLIRDKEAERKSGSQD